MAVLELLSQMKSKGMSTAQMIQSLKEQGFSPKEINEALSQSEIKSTPFGRTGPCLYDCSSEPSPNRYPNNSLSSGVYFRGSQGSEGSRRLPAPVLV